MHYFLSISQLSIGSKHKAIAMNQNPSSTIINLDEECSASHSVNEDSSEQPAGIHSVYKTFYKIFNLYYAISILFLLAISLLNQILRALE